MATTTTTNPKELVIPEKEESIQTIFKIIEDQKDLEVPTEFTKIRAKLALAFKDRAFFDSEAADELAKLITTAAVDVKNIKEDTSKEAVLNKLSFITSKRNENIKKKVEDTIIEYAKKDKEFGILFNMPTMGIKGEETGSLKTLQSKLGMNLIDKVIGSEDWFRILDKMRSIGVEKEIIQLFLEHSSYVVNYITNLTMFRTIKQEDKIVYPKHINIQESVIYDEKMDFWGWKKFGTDKIFFPLIEFFSIFFMNEDISRWENQRATIDFNSLVDNQHSGPRIIEKKDLEIQISNKQILCPPNLNLKLPNQSTVKNVLEGMDNIIINSKGQGICSFDAAESRLMQITGEPPVSVKNFNLLKNTFWWNNLYYISYQQYLFYLYGEEIKEMNRKRKSDIPCDYVNFVVENRREVIILLWIDLLLFSIT